ncbi:unnamed protein product [Ectocarpus fasciculatus]
MRTVQVAATFLAIYRVAGFVIPVSLPLRPAAVSSPTSSSQPATHVVRRQQQPPFEARHNTPVLMASSRGGRGEEEVEEVEEKGGIEPKYLAAIAVVLFAALYDLFVTHEGRLWEL